MPPEIPGSSAYYAYAQAPAKVRNVAVDFIPEPGCPIGPMAMRCELDCDAFDAPMDARVYLDYKNNSDRPVSAVKFRLRFVDGEQKDRGTFHVLGPAAAPQGVGGVKAKRDITLHPSIVGLKVRVLQVKYGDGTDWTSVKMQELVQPGGASTSSGAAPSLPSAVNSAPMVDEAADMPARQPAVAPYATGVRGKTYEVAPPGATQSYSSFGSSNGAGAVPPAMTQAAPPAMTQASPPAMIQASPPAMMQGTAPAMPQGAAPTAANIPAAPVVPFYTPPPTPKLGTSPVFNPLNEPDANGVAPPAAATSAAAPAAQPQPQPQSQPQAAPASQAAPVSQSAPTSQVQNTQPVSAISAPARTSAAANNVFATSPMAASSSAKVPVQAGQSSPNAFAATAPGATYAPAMHDANMDGPHSFSSSNSSSSSSFKSSSAPIGNSSTSLNTSANTSANTGKGTNASTGTNTGTNTGILPAATAPTKGVEPINTPWHP